MTSLRLLAPLATLCSCAFLLFAVDATLSPRIAQRNQLSFWLTLIGLITAAVLVPVAGPGLTIFGRDALVWDGAARFISGLSLTTAFFVVLIGAAYEPLQKIRLSAYYGLLLLATAGAIFIACSNDLLMIFLSIELMSLPSFILAGYVRTRRQSTEAALKFFLIGAFSTAILAYGLSLVYGLTGSTQLSALQWPVMIHERGALALVACMFLLVGFGFKIALVPFHGWVPDTFDGATTPVSAFLSISPKIAAAVAALRVFSGVFQSGSYEVVMTLALLAGLSITLANIMALRQTNLLRLLAYSSISHMGFLMLGLVAGGVSGTASVFVYGWIYLFMNIGVFTIVSLIVSKTGSHEISSLSGMSQKNPGLSALLALFLISLAGVPPTAGFLAKFYVLAAAFQAGWIKLVILGVFNTVLSIAYYFRVLRVVYFEPPVNDHIYESRVSSSLVLGVTAVLTLFLGIAPDYLIRHAAAWVPLTPNVSASVLQNASTGPGHDLVPSVIPTTTTNTPTENLPQ